jgi:hypothetical protein
MVQSPEKSRLPQTNGGSPMQAEPLQNYGHLIQLSDTVKRCLKAAVQK